MILICLPLDFMSFNVSTLSFTVFDVKNPTFRIGFHSFPSYGNVLLRDFDRFGAVMRILRDAHTSS